MQSMSIKIGLLSVLLLKTCVRKMGGLGGFAPQTLTRSYYFEPPLSKKRSRATATKHLCLHMKLAEWKAHRAITKLASRCDAQLDHLYHACILQIKNLGCNCMWLKKQLSQ